MDLRGRLRNTKVAAQDAFLPLFEAIVNSIHATEERFGLDEATTKGRIEVHVHRVQQFPVPGLAGRPPVEPIKSFTVVDNGIGFTDANLRSFETADSTAKLEKGGKGIGRLTWLVVFQSAEIESTFVDTHGQTRRRAFTFRPTDTGITDFSESDVAGDEERETHIRLVDVRESYAEPLRKGLDIIVEKIFEHCFNYFVIGCCPQVTVVDIRADGTSRVVVNERIHELDISDRERLVVGEHELTLHHVQQKHAAGRRHLAHLLADDRVVSSFQLAEVSDVGPEPIQTADGVAKVHHAFVGGSALDAAADTTRTHFRLPDGEPIHEASGLLDLGSLREAIGAAVNERLADVLEAEREATLQKIAHHIRTAQPEYARLLEHRRDELAHIKWSENSRQIDESLYRIKQGWELEIRQQQSDVERKLTEEQTDIKDIADELYRVVSETNLAGQDDLVRYVIKRRAVLQLLEKLTSRHEAALEAHIHRIVFPLRRTNQQVDYEDHNLWLVDDTLSFYEFISSDVPFSQNDAAPTDSRERPDILAFKTGDPFQHVSIVEFKKPDREDGENPVEQLARYARRLRDGGSMDVNGVTLPSVAMNVRIDAYAVVTLTPKMQKVLRDGPGEMKCVEEEWRWYGALGNLNMTVEVLDFRAFVRRARQRNQAFFRALSLP